MTMRPLLHVGYLKAGSTWLQTWLSRHPQVRFVHGSLSGGMNPLDVMREASRTEAGPGVLAVSEERLTGGLEYPHAYIRLLLRRPGFEREAAGIPEHQERVCRILHAFWPEATVLLITREFAGATRSVYSEVMRMGGDLGFPEFVEVYRPFLQAWLHYDHVIRTYRSVFGAERVVVLPFELLAQNEREFAESIEAVMGICHVPIEIGRVNASLAPAQLAWYGALARGIVRPVARRGSNGWARSVYLTHARRVIDRPLGNALVRLLQSVSPRTAPLDLPEDFLGALGGSASELKALPCFAPFASRYLNDAPA